MLNEFLFSGESSWCLFLQCGSILDVCCRIVITDSSRPIQTSFNYVTVIDSFAFNETVNTNLYERLRGILAGTESRGSHQTNISYDYEGLDINNIPSNFVLDGIIN